jgi:hypothetical protein
MTHPNRYTQMKFEHDFGNYIQRERDRAYSPPTTNHLSKTLRYCEAGQHYVPRKGTGVVNKGWKCKECRGA